jgi:hypothetical protein
MKARLVVGGIALALAVGAACVVDNSPLNIGNFRRLNEDCTVVTEFVAGGGSLDLSATSAYLVSMDLNSQTSAVPEPSGEPQTEVLNPASNEIIIDTLELDYASAGAPIGSETEGIHFVVSPGSIENRIVLELFGNPAGAAALAAATPGSTMEVGVRALGKTRSGTPVQTNRAVFPVFIFASGFPGCTPPAVQALTGPCGRVGGQDGTTVGCCPGDPDGGVVDRNCLDSL